MKKHERDYRDTLESFAHLDYFRRERTGIPEAILAEGKSDEQIAILLERMVEKTGVALATRVGRGTLKDISKRLERVATITYHESGRVVVATLEGYELPVSGGAVAILAAGTSDVPVAEEARVTAETMGCRVLTFYDVGVAGIHRLVAPLEQIRENDVAAVVAVAGMEGALPTVVRSLVPVPVIGVPTSIGYGYGGKGEAALMTMLQSCAPGLTVVNIDNGFGAGATAALIANRIAQVRKAAQKPAGRNKKRV
jgi:NCAIR mutase (PurE)-related protein